MTEPIDAHVTCARCMRRDKLIERLVCAECGGPAVDDYMVTDAVWAQAGFAKGQFCCLVCLQKRLSRPFELADFLDVPSNRLVRVGASIALRRMRKEL